MPRSLRKRDGRWAPSKPRSAARSRRCARYCLNMRQPVQVTAVEIWMNAQTKEELPAGIVAAMLADIAGEAVAPDVSARIKARVLERAGKAEQSPAPGRPGFIDVLAGAG